jgi:hypothetical protein
MRTPEQDGFPHGMPVLEDIGMPDPELARQIGAREFPFLN